MSACGVGDTQRAGGGLLAAAKRVLWWSLGLCAGIVALWFVGGILAPSAATTTTVVPVGLSRELSAQTLSAGSPTKKGGGAKGGNSGGGQSKGHAGGGSGSGSSKSKAKP